jgi:DNA-binding IclR family transcriptional regulator
MFMQDETVPERAIKNKALSRALKVLGCFSVETPELGITEICNRLGMNKGNVYDILRTFEAHGYIGQKGSNNKYYLHSNILRLAGIINKTRPQQDEISKMVRHIAKETGETVYYGIRSFNSIMYMDQVSSNTVVPRQVLGLTAPLHCTSTGKALMSVMPEPEVEEIIAAGLIRMTENTITDPGKLRKELKTTRERGYSIDNMEHEYGIKGVGVVIYDLNNNAVAGLSVSGPSLRFTEDAIIRIAGILDKHRAGIGITHF